MKKSKKLLIVFILGILFSLASNYYIYENAKNKTYSDVNLIPKNKVGLILGTGKYSNNGTINLYYKHRIEAAANLFKAGKIDIILVSGDNSKKSYNEPNYFKGDLIKAGIPEHKIYLDYAGFRTLDSIIRAKKVFGLKSFTIISQKFHNERAIYLADKKGLSTIAYNAKDLNGRFSLKTTVREYLAKTKATLDILFHKNAKFLGKKINII
jgi:SanA protein